MINGSEVTSVAISCMGSMVLTAQDYTLYHGCTLVRAVVMVATVLIGNWHFKVKLKLKNDVFRAIKSEDTEARKIQRQFLDNRHKKKCRNRLSPNFVELMTLVSLIYAQILVTIFSRGTSQHMCEV